MHWTWNVIDFNRKTSEPEIIDSLLVEDPRTIDFVGLFLTCCFGAANCCSNLRIVKRIYVSVITSVSKCIVAWIVALSEHVVNDSESELDGHQLCAWMSPDPPRQNIPFLNSLGSEL
jgi:hypothetical protein